MVGGEGEQRAIIPAQRLGPLLLALEVPADGAVEDRRAPGRQLGAAQEVAFDLVFVAEHAEGTPDLVEQIGGVPEVVLRGIVEAPVPGDDQVMLTAGRQEANLGEDRIRVAHPMCPLTAAGPPAVEHPAAGPSPHRTACLVRTSRYVIVTVLLIPAKSQDFNSIPRHARRGGRRGASAARARRARPGCGRAALRPPAAPGRRAESPPGRVGARPRGCAAPASPRCRPARPGRALEDDRSMVRRASSTKWTVAPVMRAPYSSAWRCAWSPLNAGRSAGWTFMMRFGNALEQDARDQPVEAGQDDQLDARGAERVDQRTRRTPRGWRTRGGRSRASGCAARVARSRPAARARFEITSAMRQSRLPSATRSMIACRLVPVPEMSTPAVITAVS